MRGLSPYQHRAALKRKFLEVTRPTASSNGVGATVAARGTPGPDDDSDCSCAVLQSLSSPGPGVPRAAVVAPLLSLFLPPLEENLVLCKAKGLPTLAAFPQAGCDARHVAELAEAAGFIGVGVGLPLS